MRGLLEELHRIRPKKLRDLFGFSEQPWMTWKQQQLCCYTVSIVSSAPDVLLLLGMLILGMALGALLTHIRHKAQTAQSCRSLRLSSASRPRSMIRQSLRLLH